MLLCPSCNVFRIAQLALLSSVYYPTHICVVLDTTVVPYPVLTLNAISIVYDCAWYMTTLSRGVLLLMLMAYINPELSSEAYSHPVAQSYAIELTTPYRVMMLSDAPANANNQLYLLTLSIIHAVLHATARYSKSAQIMLRLH